MIISNYFYNLESTKEARAEQFSGYSTPTIDKEPENSHINSSLCFRLSSNCISCLIIFIFKHHPFLDDIFWQQKNHPFLNDFCIKSVVRTDSLLELLTGVEPVTSSLPRTHSAS